MSAFDHFVGLAFKGLMNEYMRHATQNALIYQKKTAKIPVILKTMGSLRLMAVMSTYILNFPGIFFLGF